jgi:hypothetical protein
MIPKESYVSSPLSMLSAENYRRKTNAAVKKVVKILVLMVKCQNYGLNTTKYTEQRNLHSVTLM